MSDPAEDVVEDDFESIDIITHNTSVDLLLSRARAGQVDLQPDFHRQSGIWPDQAKSRLIESLLLRIPLPAFYAAETDNESWAIVDGVQRLATIVEFIAPGATGAEPLRLRNLEYLGREYDQATFTDLPERLQSRLREAELTVHLVRKGTPEKAKFHIFARIHAGGLPLSRQELRDALIPGQARRILKEWADSEAFKAATGYSACSDRWADREMVLRFVAFRLIDPFAYAEDDFDSFLRASMQLLNELPKVEVNELWEEFEWAMETAHEIFGDYAFRTVERDGGGGRQPINEALFEAVCVNLVMMPDDDIAMLGERREQVQEAFLDLMSDVDFQAAISPGVDEPAKVRLRFHAIRAMFWSVVGVRL